MKISKRSLLQKFAWVSAIAPWSSMFAGRAWARSEYGYPLIMQGPMVGSVHPGSAIIWLRASGRFPVAVRYGTSPDLSDGLMSKTIEVDSTTDFVAKIYIDGLQPGTKYYYRPFVRGEAARYMETTPAFSFTTAPPAGVGAKFRIGFGSCCRLLEYPVQPIWKSLGKWEPDLFFWLGDNVYADTLERSIMSDHYKAQRGVVEYRPFSARTPQLAIWDDHDYALNNHDRENPVKEDAYDIFRRFWANPSYGLADAKGIFFKYNYGGVDFFFLDTRWYRDPNDQPDSAGKTMLGREQKAWLKEQLTGSDAPFKVLISGSGWGYHPDAFGEDNWTSFPTERKELFDFIRDNDINGVLLMSGDVHRGEANCVPWSEHGGYDLYEFVSSGLAQDVGMPEDIETPEVRLREPYVGGHNAGILEFDLTKADPEVRFNLINITDQTVWDDPITIRSSDLENGIESWKAKVNEEDVPNPRRSI
ncbi:MAG: alkaline phosphatase D family protein [Porticoccaceae bacterium]